MDTENTVLSGEGFVKPLLKVLSQIVRNLSEIPSFILAIALVVLLADLIGGIKLIVEVRILLVVLAVLGVGGRLLSQILPSRVTSLRREKMKPYSRERVHLLRECLGLLTDVQFQGMIIGLLEPRERDDLSIPVTKNSFLGDMERWRQLKKVEEYLYQNFPQCAHLRREGEKNDGA